MNRNQIKINGPTKKGVLLNNIHVAYSMQAYIWMLEIGTGTRNTVSRPIYLFEVKMRPTTYISWYISRWMRPTFGQNGRIIYVSGEIYCRI